MKGYGDLEIGGLGYGDPTPINPILERGYGSPSQILRLEISGGTIDVSHLGGSQVRLIGLIPSDLQPYRALMTVDSEDVYLYSGKAGQGSDLILDRDVLVCFTPPAPVGVYDLKIRYGTGFFQEIVLSNVINVMVRNRSNETYLLRSLFPSHYNTGARTSLLDKVLDGSIREEESLSVESVLAFASSGRLWLAGSLYDYTLQSNSIQLSSPLKHDIAQGEEVIYHAYKH
jgi:hypothetical protein